MPSPTDFNLTPYYDDFTESKKFHRVLFRPSFAVQARELTQSQSILQNQVERISDHLFKQGAMVIPGENGYDVNYYAIKLASFTGAASLSDFVGVTLTGDDTNIQAKVINSVVTDGTDPDTLYIKYVDGGTDGEQTVFNDGEVLRGTLADSTLTTITLQTSNATATGSAAYVNAGVYYINGFHVQVDEQTIILDKYTNTPSYRIGLEITESIITSNDDASLNDNAQGVSNTNAPGAHRFKINLTLAKRSLTSTEDNNFVELIRLKSGVIQNQVRTTEYAVLEDTLARRTFDESGDYSVKDFELEIREHLNDGAGNRGVYAAEDGGVESKLAAGFSPGKAYVKGYEIETIGTTYIDIDKARDFETKNNFNTRYDIGNYVNVTDIYGAPDVGLVSGKTVPFERINLYNIEKPGASTAPSASGSTVPTIGRAKSRGFEIVNGTPTAAILATSSLYRHYLFDINIFTHLNIITAQSFTTGEVITGGTSGAKGTLESISTTESATITGVTKANPAVVTASNNFKEGQQVTISSVGGMTQLNGNVYTVRNPSASNFELYDTDGVTSINSTGYGTYTSGGTAAHGVVVLSSVVGDFSPGEVITGGTPSNTSTIQSNAVGFKGVTAYDFSYVRSLHMAGSPIYVANTSTTATYGSNLELIGTVSVANSDTTVTGFGTLFNEELRIGDSISFTTNAGTTITRIVESIISNTELELTTAVGGSDVSTKTVVTRLRGKIQDPARNTAIFRLPFSNVKTLKTATNSGLTDTNYEIRRQFVGTLVSGQVTFNTGANENFVSQSDEDYIVSVISGSGSLTAGDVLTTSGLNDDGANIFTLGSGDTTLTLDYGSTYGGSAEIKVIATINRQIAGSKTKTPTTINVQKTGQTEIESGVIGLGKADVYQINSVFMSSNFSTDATVSDTNITDRFDLDTGQRDNFYDIGRLKLKTGSLTPTGRLLVNFSYYTHGAGDYFDVDSYSAINYADIPDYFSDTTGGRYSLRDCLDFRPRVDDASTISSGGQDRSYDGTGASLVDVIKFDSSITCDLEYYLPRIDKIFLDKDGNFKVSKGASSLNPTYPKPLENAMQLYTLYIKSYTLNPDEIEIESVDNRRYTMRDIGKLEKRIDNIEYYTQLSLLETQAASLQIQDANGFDRFKNGFIVDDFTGHGVGDVGNPDYKVSIDMAKGELHPTFDSESIQFIEANSTGTKTTDGTAVIDTLITNSDRSSQNYQKTGDLITLPYTEVTVVEQPYASKFVNVNPFNVFTWVGTIDLNPSTDEWKETRRRPDLVINQQGSFDTMLAERGLPANSTSISQGTVWNEWQDFWVGAPNETSTQAGARIREQFWRNENPARGTGVHGGKGFRAITQKVVSTTSQVVGQSRTGVRTTVVPRVVRRSIGDRVLNVAFIPFIRSRTITFTAKRLKPNTRVYPFFDDIAISAYCTKTGDVSAGGPFVSNAKGELSGTFTIPDASIRQQARFAAGTAPEVPRWRTGKRVFRLTSSATDDRNSEVATSAEADYTAQGTLETVQNTVVSTREAQTVRQTVDERRRITRTSTQESNAVVGWWDPLAQTFLLDDPGGVFLTSIDIYFQSKDDNVPITLQIRETANGYPAPRILPFAEVIKNPEDVSVSADSSVATRFTFPSPVYIQQNIEYAFVLLANSQDYNCWVARIGQNQVGSDRTISQQPYAGVMFKSQNGSTWTAEQNEDIKFKINRAEFSNVTGNVTFVNKELPTVPLRYNALRTTNASNVIRVFHPNHGMHGLNNNVTISGITSGTLNGIPSSEINATHNSISNITLDSYDITVSSNATASGDIGGTDIRSTENRLMDVMNVNIQTLTVPDTSISYSLRTTSGKSIHSTSQSEFSLTTAANAVAISVGDNIYFNAPQMVASGVNETEEMAGSKSLFINASLSTTNTKLSPVIDVQRISGIAVQNRLNSPTSGNTPDFVDDLAATGTSTAAVYCTRPITLENTSSSLDVRLTANVQSTASIRMFYRLTSSEEVRDINTLGWTPFNTAGEEDIAVTPAEDTEEFREYKYTADNLTEYSTFQFKIVLKGTNSSTPPIVKDMRGIALAV